MGPLLWAHTGAHSGSKGPILVPRGAIDGTNVGLGVGLILIPNGSPGMPMFLNLFYFVFEKNGKPRFSKNVFSNL